MSGFFPLSFDYFISVHFSCSYSMTQETIVYS